LDIRGSSDRNDGKASMPEQVERPNTRRKTIIIIIIIIIIIFLNVLITWEQFRLLKVCQPQPTNFA